LSKGCQPAMWRHTDEQTLVCWIRSETTAGVPLPSATFYQLELAYYDSPHSSQCGCEDFFRRGGACKHIRLALLCILQAIHGGSAALGLEVPDLPRTSQEAIHRATLSIREKQSIKMQSPFLVQGDSRSLILAGLPEGVTQESHCKRVLTSPSPSKSRQLLTPPTSSWHLLLDSLEVSTCEDLGDTDAEGETEDESMESPEDHLPPDDDGYSPEEPGNSTSAESMTKEAESLALCAESSLGNVSTLAEI
jgi:hypothetical protein